MRHLARIVFALASQFAAVGVALAATAPAGTAVGVNPSASNVTPVATRTLVVGSDVDMGDRIVTGRTGQVQLIFNDDTHLVVGPSSSLVVESYLLRNDKSVGQFAVNALSGTFRFITGKSDHSAYTISTPTGTIGVRGTAFDFLIDPRHPVVPGYQPGTWVTLFRGAVQLCDLAGKCVTLSQRCELGGASTSDSFTVGRIEAAEGGARDRFRYIASQRPLMPQFRVDESRLCFLNNNNNSTNSLSTPIPGGKTFTPKPRGVP